MSRQPSASPQPPGKRIVLADDHELVRSGIKTLLLSLPGVEVVAEARNGSELLETLESTVADVVITDLTMPGMDGFAAIECIRARHPSLAILVLSMHHSGERVKRAMDAGADGYITKEASEAELDIALRSVLSRGKYFSPGLMQRLLEREQQAPEPADLTQRQQEILSMLVQGRASKEIGYRLGISPRTVDVHRRRIMQRLNTYDVAGLTRYALRTALIEP